MAIQKLNITQMEKLPAQYLNNSGNLSTPKKTIVLYGWAFGNSAGGGISITINFGMTFASPPIVMANTAGYKTGSDPTSYGDNLGVAGEVTRGGFQTTTTSTVVYITGPSGGSINAGVRILVNLIIIGEVA